MGSRDKKSKEKKSRRDRSPGSRSKSRRRDKDEKSREDRSKKSSKRHRRDKESPRRSKERKSKDKKSRSQSRERRKNGKSSKKSSRRDRSRSREKRKDRGGRDDRRGGGRDDRRGGRDAEKYTDSYSEDISRDDKYGKETEEYYEYENYPDRWNQVHAAHKVSYALSHGNRTSDEGGNRWPVTEQPRRDENRKFKFRTVGNLTRQASRLHREAEERGRYDDHFDEEHDDFNDDDDFRGGNTTSGPSSRFPSQHTSNHTSQYGNGIFSYSIQNILF